MNLQLNKGTMEILKKMFILIAYFSYVGLTVAKNQLKLDLGNYEYILVGIIGVCMKLAYNLDYVEQLINNVSLDDLKSITEQLSEITLSLSQPNITTRSLLKHDTPRADTPSEPVMLEINEPIEPSENGEEEITHRDVKLNDNYVLRIHK